MLGGMTRALPEKCEAVFGLEVRDNKELEPGFDSIKTGNALMGYTILPTSVDDQSVQQRHTNPPKRS